MFELESSYGEFESGADHFVVETRMPGGIVLAPRGHEVLTRSAAAGLTLTRAEIDALVEGVRRVDTVFPTRHFDPNEQKRHALRRARCTSMAVALSEIRNHFILLHSRALRATTRLDAMRWIGEALHLLQDSFSEAHTARTFRATGAPHPIRFIRFFGLQGLPAPVEHQVFPMPDPRDLITVGGRLRPAAAHSVVASKEFLSLMLRHLSRPTLPVRPTMLRPIRSISPAVAAGLRAFMNRHLVLGRPRIEPKSIYPTCPR
jgi:hypothetical protein